uniref:Uncharacterized protein n=1 Tax=Erythrolobus madagascarensis TaxID=708628 RepID=A0A7S0T8T1_9RHOD|mmetsp:Transcript_4805/g.10270  ORF Transcript_4805/g.10270 Transcript_4805/m.10270 type:complete len:191 (+) Transcript_4805:262-834(+)
MVKIEGRKKKPTTLVVVTSAAPGEPISKMDGTPRSASPFLAQDRSSRPGSTAFSPSLLSPTGNTIRRLCDYGPLSRSPQPQVYSPRPRRTTQNPWLVEQSVAESSEQVHLVQENEEVSEKLEVPSGKSLLESMPSCSKKSSLENMPSSLYSIPGRSTPELGSYRRRMTQDSAFNCGGLSPVEEQPNETLW